MPTMTQKSLTAAFTGAALEKDLQQLESVTGALSASGFEFRGGDVFGQEIFSIYINDRTDEFAILRFNRPANEPPLILRGRMDELDQPMSRMDMLPFVPVAEFFGKTETPAPQPLAAASPTAKPRAPGM
jgi:hypothetical protein